MESELSKNRLTTPRTVAELQLAFDQTDEGSITSESEVAQPKGSSLFSAAGTLQVTFFPKLPNKVEKTSRENG